MAFRTRRGDLVAIPSAVFTWTLVVVWLVGILQAPTVAIAVIGVARLAEAPVELLMPEFAETLVALLPNTWAVSTGALTVLSQLGWFSIIPIQSSWRRFVILLSSRPVGLIILWIVLLTAGLAGTKAPPPVAWWLLTIAGGFTVPLFVAILVTVARTRRRSAAFSLLDGLSDEQIESGTTPASGWGPGNDFRDGPEAITKVSLARGYENIARARQVSREHAGLVTGVVAGAFIASVTIWAFTSRIAGSILLVFAVIAIMWVGHQIERRAAFYETLAQRYSERADALEELQESAKGKISRRWWNARSSTRKR